MSDRPRYGKNKKTGKKGVRICEELFFEDGWTFKPEDPELDLGIDAKAELLDLDDNGERTLGTGREIAIQIKTGSSFFTEKSGNDWVFRFEEKHRNYWLQHSLPVLVILVDDNTRECYWERIEPDTVLSTGKQWKTIVPSSQRLDSQGFAEIAKIALNGRVREMTLDTAGGYETVAFRWLPALTPKGTKYVPYSKDGSPIQISAKLGTQAITSLKEHIERGLSCEIDGEIVSSNFLPEQYGKDWRFKAQIPEKTTGQVRNVLMDWHGKDGFQFAQEFAVRMVRAGTKEFVYETIIGYKEYFRLTCRPAEKWVNLNYSFRIAGALAKNAYQTLLLSKSVGNGGTLSLRAVDTDLTLLETDWEEPGFEEVDQAIEVVRLYLEVQKALKRSLRLPRDWYSPAEISNIEDLYEIVTTGQIVRDHTISISVTPQLAAHIKAETPNVANWGCEGSSPAFRIGESILDLGKCFIVVAEPVIAPNPGDSDIPPEPYSLVSMRSKVGRVVYHFEEYRGVAEN
ncbi:MAG: DUF4365 domain-containing protein [Candidatus Eremiobacteraeota bacterium]|nr:DUF4365 domain-containing protein [Candidatus Eremiobacteraeota bacterium]